MPTEAQKRVLTAILATIDALFMPHRPTRGEDAKRFTAIVERRQAYSKTGIPYAIGGDAASRMAGSRETAELVDLGLVTVRGRTNNRGIRLTDSGDDLMRRLTAGYLAGEVWPLLELVAVLRDAGQHNAGHVLEIDILDLTYEKAQATNALVPLKLKSLSLAARGWLDSSCDSQGHIGYSITPAGRAALVAGRPEKPALPAYDHALGDLYDDLLADALEERAGWDCLHQNHVAIKLGAGSWSRGASDA